MSIMHFIQIDSFHKANVLTSDQVYSFFSFVGQIVLRPLPEAGVPLLSINVSSSSPIRLVHRHLETENTTTLPLEQQEALNDDLLEMIFLRIACPADLLRASTACTSFHRLITTDAFFRRYRSHHGPQLLGFLDFGISKGFLPVKAPPPQRPGHPRPGQQHLH
ncbi:hypothetical protein PR202_ga27566 [Eleusine coracana subsp. coracana]|uniref:F-box domain-containing protein n=1 Tax=Eleusine coracana subsp. coracana TaxID=191504 RepID=A0AAV5DH66_ELECO|nr:hypothetical protein PR202_ga27566 [Eleusine coracana subsp. coracana]